MIVSWEKSWDEFVPFLEYPIELRKIVYTANAIESLNARFRREHVVLEPLQIGDRHLGVGADVERPAPPPSR